MLVFVHLFDFGWFLLSCQGENSVKTCRPSFTLKNKVTGAMDPHRKDFNKYLLNPLPHDVLSVL